MFLDLDLTTAFHQIPLDPETARLLSVQTPWGQYQPRFMPEGINAATQKLQKTVREIFVNSKNEHYIIQAHDNILIMCHDYEDACIKLKEFLETATKYNVALKMSKSWLGYKTVNFFGYVCSGKEHHLTDKRKQAIASIPFPSYNQLNKNVKAMQSLLGCGVYFKPFVKDYSAFAQPLYDSIKKEFD